MGRPDQGNKAQTPVGYSHGTGVSTGGPATAVLGVVARDTPGVHGVVWGLQRCGAPWECYTGLRGQPAGPRSGDGAKMCAWKVMTVGSSGGQYGGRRGDGMAAWRERSQGTRGLPGGGVLESWGSTRRYWDPYGGGTRRHWGAVQWGSSGEVPDDGVLTSWGCTRRYRGPYGGGMRRYWSPYGGGTRRYWGTVQWGSTGKHGGTGVSP